MKKTVLLFVIALFTLTCNDKKEEIEPKHYTVNFAGEGVDVDAQSVLEGDYAIEPENPVRGGYFFDGWFTDNNVFASKWDFKTDVVKQDTTLYAKWEEKYYTVNFAGEGIDIESQSIAEGGYAIEPENPEREGYLFDGWFTDNGAFENEWDFESDIVTQDTMLYAKWEKITLQGSWKLIGIVDVQSGELKVLEPKDCDACYTLIFYSDNTFGGRTIKNSLWGKYEIDYKTSTLKIIESVQSEIAESKEAELFTNLLIILCYTNTQSFFTVVNTHPRILHIYYPDGNKYNKYKKI